MEIVFEVEKSNFSEVREILLKDDVVSRASIVFRESGSLGLDNDNYLVYVSGLDEACGKAKELLKELGKEADQKLKEQVIEKIKEDEDSVASGFGTLF